MEYGTGWSSLIIYKALEFNKNKNKNKFYTRCDNPYSLTVVDNSKKFLKISSDRITSEFGKNANVNFHYSKCEMTKFNGNYAHQYIKHPPINPDFIFLDGPNNFFVDGKCENFSVKNFSMQPMGCDILKFENFLTPGTIILSDGRTANMRFLKNNFKRNWKSKTLYNSDLNILFLDEKTTWNLE